MKQEDKELLLKDLCSRLPHGVKVRVTPLPLKEYEHLSYDAKVFNINNNCIVGVTTFDNVKYIPCDITEVKPYLFPLSSMTEEQCDELYNISELRLTFTPGEKIKVYKDTIEWFLKNHIDYNGLIPNGLAIDCTNLKIY